MAIDRERLQRCLAVVEAYQASGQKASAWAAANGISVRELASWCAHAQRWRARLDGVAPPPRKAAAAAAGATFVALPMAGLSGAMGAGASGAAAAAELRLDWPLAPGKMLTLHWPASRLGELTQWLTHGLGQTLR